MRYAITPCSPARTWTTSARDRSSARSPTVEAPRLRAMEQYAAVLRDYMNHVEPMVDDALSRGRQNNQGGRIVARVNSSVRHFARGQTTDRAR